MHAWGCFVHPPHLSSVTQGACMRESASVPFPHLWLVMQSGNALVHSLHLWLVTHGACIHGRALVHSIFMVSHAGCMYAWKVVMPSPVLIVSHAWCVHAWEVL